MTFDYTDRQNIFYFQTVEHTNLFVKIACVRHAMYQACSLQF